MNITFVIKLCTFLCYLTVFACNSLCCNQPNFIVILTDDEDVTLGGLDPMQRARSLIGRKGAEFINMFVTTPLCCPSRSSILTGKYAHNHGVVNNSVNGNCNSYLWQEKYEPKSFITNFKKAGYSTLYAGKYLNQYGKEEVGGVKHIPPGWDHWMTLVGNSRYYNYSLSVNGRKEKHGSDPDKDYLTDIIMRKATGFLHAQNGTVPFFVFLSPPAPHAPFIPSPKFKKKFSNLTAPRTPNFNYHGGKDKHWLLRQPPKPLPKVVIQNIDEVFRNRWRTLLSVDDGIYEIVKVLEQKGLLENTYIFFTSDNGFHLGQFSLPWDKRQPYEFDVRVPLLVRGPGIKSGLKIKHPVLNIDLAPTFLALANISLSKDFDGKSFAPLLKGSSVKHSYESSFIIEHNGESSDKPIPGCPQYQPKEVNTCEIDCICEDSWNNTYICIRELSDIENSITCLFKDNENFIESYNISEDPFQLKNLFPVLKNIEFVSTQKLMNFLKCN